VTQNRETRETHRSWVWGKAVWVAIKLQLQVTTV